MTRYVWKEGAGWLDKATGEKMAVPEGPPAQPRIAPTMPAYQSPIDGRWITTRHERQEDMKRNNCVEAGDPGLSPTGGKVKSERMAKKYGLKVSEEYR